MCLVVVLASTALRDLSQLRILDRMAKTAVVGHVAHVQVLHLVEAFIERHVCHSRAIYPSSILKMSAMVFLILTVVKEPVQASLYFPGLGTGDTYIAVR